MDSNDGKELNLNYFYMHTNFGQKYLKTAIVLRGTPGRCVLPELGFSRTSSTSGAVHPAGPADHLCWHVYILSLGNAKIIQAVADMHEGWIKIFAL